MRLWTGCLLACLALTGRAAAQAGAAPEPAAGQAGSRAPAWSWTLADTTRVETWRFFAPHAGGGDPDYTFAGNRLFLQGRRSSARFDLTLAAQHVGLLALPAAATGPGALGTGALYYSQGGGRVRPQQLYLRYAHLRLKDVAPGLDVQIGRQPYASGAERLTAHPEIETIKRQRLDARLVGEFEWSLYQRAFDGIRLDWRRRAAGVTAVAFMPTQGGFARDGNETMTRLVVTGATLDVPPADGWPAELQAFWWYYRDRRLVTGRPDNSGRAVARADLDIATFGGSAVVARQAGAGEVDALGWIAGQGGDWYGEPHRAVAVAAEAGYQWSRAAWTPWLRAGLLRASGDADPVDGRPHTFFPMLPTVRRFSQTTVYSTMNLDDLFAQLLLRPHSDLVLRLDTHRLRLASAADRWYAGSGATLSSGGNFGYVGRGSGGARSLGTSIEASAAWTASPRWTLNAFVGRIQGGPVVTSSFAGDRLWFVYVENGVRWQVGR